MFDRDYAARLVLGRHGRGASDADVKLFADALADNLMQRYGSSLLDFNTKLRVRIKSETAAAARPRRQGRPARCCAGRRADPGRLPDAQVRRQLEGVRRDGRGRVASCRPSASSSTASSPTSRSRRSPPTCARQAAGRCQALIRRIGHASVERAGDALRFAGALLRADVAALWQQAPPQLAGVRRFDLTAVTRVDSAGLALLAELADALRRRRRSTARPPGLAELRAAYRLTPALAFA